MNTIRILHSITSAVVVFASPASLPLFAQDPSAAATTPAATSSGPIAKGELGNFGKFLARHPDIEARLRENPALANDAAFQKNHPEFAKYLTKHPNVAADLSAKPRWFIHRELARQAATPMTRAQVVAFDKFLDQHPNLAGDLAKNPQSLRDPAYLDSHAELNEYLKSHPGTASAAESKPGKLTKREKKLAQTEPVT